MIRIDNICSVNNIIEKTKIFSEKYGNVVLFTNGNSWYIPTLIHNLLKSMEIHEPSHKIIVFCSDKDGYNKCSEIGFKYFEYIDIPELNLSNILSGSSSNTKAYTSLCFVKIVIMKHILKLGYTPLYLDPDMAFLSPSIDDLLSYLDKNDFVCAGTTDYLNSNIMIAKPSSFNKKLFKLKLDDYNKILDGVGIYSDEDLLRPRLKNHTFSCIDNNKYPPGCDAIKYIKVAKIIHSNCVSGLENKIKLMKECNAWFLTPIEISPEFVVKVKDIYPPFLEGELFETYFSEYIKNNNPILNRKYINVSWTNLYCNLQFKGIPYNSEKLQKELDALPQDGKYFTIVQFDEGIKYHKLPLDTIVLGCCSGDIPIPLTYDTSAFYGKKFKTWDTKPIFCSFLGQQSHALRKKILEYVKQFPDYYYYQASSLSTNNQKLYIERSIESKFCLAPRGFGRSSFRFFEILKLGSVPVYIWDDIDWLPFKDKVDYSKMCVSINIKDLDKLDSILRNINKKQYEDMIFYYKKVQHFFTYLGMSKEILNIINETKFIQPRICIVTILIGNPPYKNKVKENHSKYCHKYGYSYVCLEDKINDFHPSWMKQELILSTFKEGYDYVFWMNGDSFFINMNISFDKFIEYPENFIATGDENDIINGSHLLFKNNEWSIKFIEKWIKFRQPLKQAVYEKFKNITTHFNEVNNNIIFNDQPPINLMLGGADENYQEDWFDIFNKVNLYNGNCLRKYNNDYSPINQNNLERTHSLICDDMKEHVRILEQSTMNSYPSTYKKGDFIIHFITNKTNFNEILEKIYIELTM